MSAAWSVTYETATIQAGTAPTKEEAERIAGNVHDSYVVKGLNPDALAWHVAGEVYEPQKCPDCSDTFTPQDGESLCTDCGERDREYAAQCERDERAWEWDLNNRIKAGAGGLLMRRPTFAFPPDEVDQPPDESEAPIQWCRECPRALLNGYVCPCQDRRKRPAKKRSAAFDAECEARR